MLVLTRKPGEKILIGDDIVITVLDARGDSVRIGIDAPRGVKIQREEVVRAVSEANVAASTISSEAEDRIKRSLGALAAVHSTESVQSALSQQPEPQKPSDTAVPGGAEPRPTPALPHPPTHS